MIRSLVRRLASGPRALGDQRFCAVCHEPLGEATVLRVHGLRVHRDCLGYRARHALRG